MDSPDYDRLADAAVTAALHEDAVGIGLVMAGLDATALRHLGARLAVQAANALVAWGADADLDRAGVVEIWQRGLVLQQAAARRPRPPAEGHG